MKFTITANQLDFAQLQKKIAVATNATLREIASDAIAEGRRNIASSGHFAAKWQNDLQFRMNNGGVTIFHKSALAGVFESGVIIAGKPLLWIPTTPGAPPPKRSGKRLVAAIVRGTHVLFDKDDRDRHRRPLYFGVPIARIPKKWRITEITKANVAKFAAVFHKYFRED